MDKIYSAKTKTAELCRIGENGELRLRHLRDPKVLAFLKIAAKAFSEQ
jgi:hypothetical protein